MLACSNENIDEIRFLLSKNAKVNLKNKNNQTAYHIALSKNNAEMVSLLERAGAKK